MALRLLVDYPSQEQFIEAVELEVAHGGLLVRGATTPPPGVVDCVVEVRLAGERLAEVSGRIGAVGRTGLTVVFDKAPAELVAQAERFRTGSPGPEEETAPEEPRVPAQQRGTIAERLAALTVPQKIQLALAGDREARIALLRDHNKVLHAFVLKNPRIQLDEVLFAAKLNTLSPDALKHISEHPEWGQNLQVMTALVRNARTPLPVALRLLPRLSSTDVRAIAKGGARDQLVAAARKFLSAGG